MCVCVCLCIARALSPVWLSAAPRTVAHQACLSLGFPRQEYWSGLQFPSLGIFPTQELRLHPLCLPHCKQVLYLLSHQGNPDISSRQSIKNIFFPSLCAISWHVLKEVWKDRDFGVGQTGIYQYQIWSLSTLWLLICYLISHNFSCFFS